MRPVGFALAVLVSTWVLHDARRKRLSAFACAAWTLLALLFPPVILPLYLIARGFMRQPAAEIADAPEVAPQADGARHVAPPGASAQTNATAFEGRALGPQSRWSRALPLFYLSMLAALGALYFYLDYETTDAHLVRATQAKLDNRPGRAIREYRAALVLEDDPHIHKLLGVELARAGSTEEALAEFLTAERGGEPDELLSLHIADALYVLGRPQEAAPQYQKFLQSRFCAGKLSDVRCEESRARLLAIGATATR